MECSGTLQQLVSAAVSLHSARTAVTYDGGDDGSESLMYGEVAQLSSELSVILRENCSNNNGVIGLYCRDDLFIPVWLLGILQASAAYVPLDPEAPGFLSARVMQRCGLKYCAVKTNILQRFQATLDKQVSLEVVVVLPKFKLTLMRIEPLQTAVATPEHGPCDAAGAAGRRDLAYVLHTSGTTGLPKIVRVPHKCILPNILHLRSLFQMCAEDVVFLASPLTFDPSVVDIFLALSSGARLLIVPAVVKKMPRRLARLLFRDHKTTVLQVTPTLLVRFGQRVLRQEVLCSGSSLRVLALGGEACPPPALLAGWRHKDNTAHIYNIYGITEVSCWACVYRIPESLLTPGDTASCVPLGTPLMDTKVEVRDEHGGVVTEGEGQVFIGGEHRVCLLDDEDTLVPWTMRASGDWVDVRGTRMSYLGRRDRLIKRHGKRVNLDSVQQLILGLPQVESCAVTLCEGSRLLAFVVASTSGDGEAASHTSGRTRAEQTPLAGVEEEGEEEEEEEEEGGEADGALNRLILDQLSLLLPSYSVPDSLMLVPALCLSRHGKVDTEALLKMYHTQRQRLGSKSTQGDVTKLKQSLQSMWRETLCLPEGAVIHQDSNFLLSGGDSLKALQLCDHLQASVGAACPGLLEALLDQTFTDVLRHLERATTTLRTKKRHADPPDATPAKNQRTEQNTVANRMQGDENTADFRVVLRAGQLVEVKTKNPKALGEKDSAAKPRDEVLSLSLAWSSDTGRCVDASPVILVKDGAGQRSGRSTVFIGSHSHRLQALDLVSGALLWERVLGGRVEASAAVTPSGSLVVVGCYDGCVYFLCAESGETRWTFKTGDAVKSSAAVDPVTGLVMVGSHDGHVYALDPKAQRCVWRRHCGGGAVFSSPYLNTSLRQLYVATLGGHLLCVDADSGDVLWSHRGDVPFFSSPNHCSGLGVLIGSVDGHICCFSDTGELVWRFLTEGPVFSSPCLSPDRRRLLCGSHDGHVYCLNCSDGSLAWAFQTSGKVYSSPCVFHGSARGQTGVLVGVASTDGTVWILDGRDGQMLTSLALPGELFSSPVAWGRSLLVGCRNDYVYCLQLTVKEET